MCAQIWLEIVNYSKTVGLIDICHDLFASLGAHRRRREKKNAFFPANGVDRSEQLAVHNQFSTASNVSLLSGGYWIISQDNIS